MLWKCVKCLILVGLLEVVIEVILGDLARKFEFWSRYMDGTDTLVLAAEHLFWNVNIPPYDMKIYYNITVLYYIYAVSCKTFIFATWMSVVCQVKMLYQLAITPAIAVTVHIDNLTRKNPQSYFEFDFGVYV